MHKIFNIFKIVFLNSFRYKFYYRIILFNLINWIMTILGNSWTLLFSILELVTSLNLKKCEALFFQSRKIRLRSNYYYPPWILLTNSENQFQKVQKLLISLTCPTISLAEKYYKLLRTLSSHPLSRVGNCQRRLISKFPVPSLPRHWRDSQLNIYL